MRRRLLLLPVILLLACRAISSLTSPATPTTLPATATATFAATSSLAPTPQTTPTAPALPAQPETQYQVRTHPDGSLYVGDQVSIEVIAPPGAPMDGRRVEVEVEGVEDGKFAPVDFGRHGIGGRVQATLTWVWDTSGLPAGSYTLAFTVLPDEVAWNETVSLLPESDLPADEAGALWAHAESDCCLVYYITGTQAERDLERLLSMIDQQAALVEQRFERTFSKAPVLVLLPRVLGHGGFANEEIAVSTLDRRYSGADPAIVVRHELVHVLDRQLGGDLRPTILVEGLAVYVSGGHFKEEPLLPRAAALLQIGRYQDLERLADDFYPAQHETGYLEAGALVDYMVERWGWEAFNEFYRDIHAGAGNIGQVAAMELGLKRHFGVSFADLEADFLGTLRNQEVPPEYVDDVRLTLDFYDTVRRYQQALDPSAYYLTAWLPDTQQVRQRGIVADYLRHPGAPENVALEDLLVSADESLRQGDYPTTERLLQAVNGALDAVNQR